MTKFVINANLPQHADCIIIGQKYYDILDNALKNLSVKCICIPDNPQVDCRLSGHADISALHLGSNRLLLSSYLKGSKTASKLEELGCQLSYLNTEQSHKYPYDVQLNICIIGTHCILNQSTASKEFTQDIQSMHLIQTHQGYSRCSICVVNDNAIITADKSIHLSAISEGIDSLLISQGGIALEGFDYGFIGGAAFKISRNELAFTGTLSVLSDDDRNAIMKFLYKHEITPLFLTNLPAFDIGGAIPIIEK